jgi:aspartate-semialdehyde dehydrogenase
MDDYDTNGVLGATGAVGTRFILLLLQHLLLELGAVGAFEKLADKKYCVGSSQPQCPPQI